MIHKLHRSRQRRGVAAVEMALLAPLILYLLLGLWEVGRMIEINQLLSNAAREGGRQASTGLNDSTAVQTVVTNYLKNAKLPTGNVTVTVTNQTSGADPTAATQLDQMEVKVSIPFADVQWIALSLISSPGTTLTGKATWSSLRDQPYPGNATVPAGW